MWVTAYGVFNEAGNQNQVRELAESIDREKGTRAEIPARAQSAPVFLREPA
jgi:hypothetical protein